MLFANQSHYKKLNTQDPTNLGVSFLYVEATSSRGHLLTPLYDVVGMDCSVYKKMFIQRHIMTCRKQKSDVVTTLYRRIFVYRVLLELSECVIMRQIRSRDTNKLSFVTFYQSNMWFIECNEIISFLLVIIYVEHFQYCSL